MYIFCANCEQSNSYNKLDDISSILAEDICPYCEFKGTEKYLLMNPYLNGVQRIQVPEKLSKRWMPKKKT